MINNRRMGLLFFIDSENNRERSHVKKNAPPRRYESCSSGYSYGKYLRAKLQGIKMSRGKLEPRPRLSRFSSFFSKIACPGGGQSEEEEEEGEEVRRKDGEKNIEELEEKVRN